VSKKVASRGLCSTCKHADACASSRDPDELVLHCEEFEVEGPLPMAVAGKERAARNRPPVTQNEDSAEHYGLCRNCENRETCLFPKPEGGIWHCEEYR
jgi:hypothetical protein